MSALASDAGVASALIYYYFGSKSGLFQSVVETARMRLKERVIAPILAVVAHQGSLEARVTTLVSVLAHRGRDDIGLHRLILAGDLEAEIPEVLSVRETIGEDIQRLYWAVAGLNEHGPENDRERQLVATIELLVLGIWLFGMRRHGVERLPIVVQAFMDLLAGTLFVADNEDEPQEGTETREETRTSSEALDDDAALEERLASIALHRFASGGYGTTSLKEIATLAGVTTGAIFHYFGSKAGLYRAAGALGIQRMVDRSAYSIALANVRGEGKQRERVKAHFQSIGATVDDLVDNHWMGLRVQVDAELYPALVEMRDEWADALEQHYRSVTGGVEPSSGSGERVPAQEPLPVLLDVLT
ncbi:TetR/AcrR family transcriptional regulator, partial [Arthrobacter sp. OV608]|uniref:TetR/AcrR family transcriptional regulator n=1 Tax=Arthrobacter sp. OV608 TaxID=1882768 RepID=UPI0008D698FC